MTTLVKIHRKGQVTLPSRLRDAIGVAEGDVVVATVRRGAIVLTPKPSIDRSKFPDAAGEYSSEQRRIIDARLDKATEQLKSGHVSPAFETAAEFEASLKAEAKKLKSKTKRLAR
jgi:AbrB family looped-hinge helix DNA binding protein